jgi:hypothetical protein
MKNSEQTATAAETIPFDQELKNKLDLAWEKIESGRQQEDEGRKQRIEGTLELAKILLDLRLRFPADREFGERLTKNGYGENRISRQDRAALINMAEHPDLAREVLEQTHRQSYRLIWEEEIQPELEKRRLPSAGQPALSENFNGTPVVSTNGNLAGVPIPPVIQPSKTTTHRPKTSNGSLNPDTAKHDVLAFDKAIKTLLTLRTKPIATFVGTEHHASDVSSVRLFLYEVVAALDEQKQASADSVEDADDEADDADDDTHLN